MSNFAVKLCLTAAFTTIISCASLGYGESVKANDVIVFEPDHNKDTGFNVGFIGVPYKDSDRTTFNGFDSGFVGTTPGYTNSHTGIDEVFPGVSQGNGEGQIIIPGYASGPSFSVSDLRPGFATVRPGFGHSTSGYDTIQPGIVSLNPYQSAVNYPWFIGRNTRQTFNDGTRPGFSQGNPNIFDIGFDGTRPGFSQGNVRPGFDGTRPGFSQGNPNKFDVGFDGTRPGFSQGNQNHFDVGFDGTRPGFSQGVQRPGFSQRYPRDSTAESDNLHSKRQTANDGTKPGFSQGHVKPGFDGTQPGFSQGIPQNPELDGTRPGSSQRKSRDLTELDGLRIKRQTFDSGFDGTRPGFAQNSRPKFDAGFDGTRPGFSQKVSPNFDAGFDGTRPGFAQNSRPNFDAGFDGTRPGFLQRYPRDHTGTISSDASLRTKRSTESEFLESELLGNDNEQLVQSEKFLLQPHNYKNRGPFIPVWNNQPIAPYPTYFNNPGGFYGPMGSPREAPWEY